MLQCTSIGHNTTGWNHTFAQGPQEILIVLFAQGFGRFNIRQGTRHAFIGIVNGRIYRCAVFCLQSIFAVPDVQRGALQRNIGIMWRHNLKFCGHSDSLCLVG